MWENGEWWQEIIVAGYGDRWWMGLGLEGVSIETRIQDRVVWGFYGEFFEIGVGKTGLGIEFPKNWAYQTNQMKISSIFIRNGSPLLTNL